MFHLTSYHRLKRSLWLNFKSCVAEEKVRSDGFEGGTGGEGGLRILLFVYLIIVVESYSITQAGV